MAPTLDRWSRINPLRQQSAMSNTGLSILCTAVGDSCIDEIRNYYKNKKEGTLRYMGSPCQFIYKVEPLTAFGCKQLQH
ncbi:hypothetical protein DPMN_087531 [Dreissena polymorpha]|uniref:Uncharacterized protein n=1 Tax=Dreissena polymorpha TaxID=45954 RepID=A0A9D4KSV2_DREPO|nr:hypothetical protein DPMN_087531 [Dreissena polymorpha]